MHFNEAGLNELLERIKALSDAGENEPGFSVEEVRELMDPGGAPWIWGDEHCDFIKAWARRNGVTLSSRVKERTIWFKLD